MGVRLEVRSGWSEDGDTVTYELEQSRIVIGRGRGADVRLPHRAVSVRHATIEQRGAGYVLVDDGSTNGVLVGGARIVPGRPKPLRDGDRFELGGFAFAFRSGVPVSVGPSAERTASLARRLVSAPSKLPNEIAITILNGPTEGARVILPSAPGRVTAGRGEQCAILLEDADASREHAEIVVDEHGAIVRDLDSKNGIEVNRKRVVERRLRDKDEIRIGSTLLGFEDPREAAVLEAEQGDDLAVEPPRAAAPAAPAPDGSPESGPEPELPPEPAPPPPAPAPRRVASVDTIVYVLAATVIALSALALFWLVRSG